MYNFNDQNDQHSVEVRETFILYTYIYIYGFQKRENTQKVFKIQKLKDKIKHMQLKIGEIFKIPI